MDGVLGPGQLVAGGGAGAAGRGEGSGAARQRLLPLHLHLPRRHPDRIRPGLAHRRQRGLGSFLTDREELSVIAFLTPRKTTITESDIIPRCNLTSSYPSFLPKSSVFQSHTTRSFYYEYLLTSEGRLQFHLSPGKVFTWPFGLALFWCRTFGELDIGLDYGDYEGAEDKLIISQKYCEREDGCRKVTTHGPVRASQPCISDVGGFLWRDS